MANTGKQSPLGVNVLGSVLQNTGLNINPVAASYMGASKINGTGGTGVPGVGASGYRFGKLVQNTALRLLTWSIHDAYWRGIINLQTVNSGVYDSLIDIKGNGTQQIRGLGNSKSDNYIIFDPKTPQDPNGAWKGQATTGYAVVGNTDQGQSATWIPYNLSNPNRSITQWGFIRCYALQAWYEFNWNGIPVDRDNPEYKEFTSSFLTANSFVKNTNAAIYSMEHGKTFLKGTYSNQDDLITADITGVSLALQIFGQDLINLGKTIDLENLPTFGLPSNLLKTLKKVNAITQSLSLALLSANITPNDLNNLFAGGTVTTQQEKQIYGAFGIIGGVDLEQILIPLNCKTQGLRILTDLLDLKKLFPLSLNTLTVPVYNISPGPTNSKTYYPIFVNGGVNSQVLSRGFGDYLIGILPNDQAQSAGAFSTSMLQIRNIQTVNFEKFAQVTFSLENNRGLPSTNGTDVPTNVPLATQGVTLSAAGAGVYGTYTMSDLFGCMSGLPYPWQSIFNNINLLTTRKLSNIYQQNFLAVTWEKAELRLTQPYYYTTIIPYRPPSVASNPANPGYQPDPMLPNYDPNPYIGNGGSGLPTTCPTYYDTPGNPAVYDWYYTLRIIQTEDGGGYGRGTAPNPVVTILPNNVKASVSTNVGRNDMDAASNGGGTYGRVSTSINNGKPYLWYPNDVQTNWVDISGQNTSDATPTPPIIPPRNAAWVEANMPKETISIQHAPTALLPVQTNGSVATDGQNTPGAVWDRNGMVSPGTVAWPSPMNSVVSAYINQANTEISSIYQNGNQVVVKQFNAEWNLIGTLLTIEQRARFTGIAPVPIISPPVAPVPYTATGSTKDYNLNPYPNTLINFVDSIPGLSVETDPHMAAQTLEAISNFSTTGGQSLVGQMRQERNSSRLNELGIEQDNNIPAELSQPQKQILLANGTIPKAINGIPSSAIGPGDEIVQYTPPPFVAVINADNEEEFTIPTIVVNPNIPAQYDQGGAPVLADTTQFTFGSILPILDADYLGPNGDGTGPAGTGPTIPVVYVNTRVPRISNTVVNITDPVAKGAVNQTQTLLPINLNTLYTSGSLLPSTYGIEEAIEKVIECNCDCWID